MKVLPGRFKPQLTARWLVTIDGEHQVHAWQFASDNWGKVRLVAQDSLPQGLAIVTLHSALPYRRRLQCFPANRAAGQAILTGAGDEFPFPSDDLVFALSSKQEDTYLCAIEKGRLEQLIPRGITPQAVLVADPDATSAAEAFAQYRKYRSLLDFSGNTRWLIDRHRLRFFGRLFGFLAVTLTCLVLLLNPSWPSYLLQWRLENLEAEIEPQRQQQGTIQRMAAAQRAIASLYEQPESKVSLLMQKAWDTLPPGHAISRIELRGGTLILGGNGSDPMPWLISLGIPESVINIESAGTYTHFRAEVPLAQWSQKSASSL